MDEWIICDNCGFGCLKSQRTKTKNNCPRCNKVEEKAFLDRKKAWESGE